MDAETKAEHEDRRCCCAPILREQPRGKAQVRRNVVHPARASRLTAIVLDALDAAELNSRALARLAFRQSSRDVIGHGAIEMEAQLGVELVLQPPAMPDALPPGHGASPCAPRRIRRIASESRSQLSASDFRYARPRAVSV